MAPIIRAAKTSLSGTAAPRVAGAPRVSVIIPTYNRADLVGRAVHSVLTQTFTDLEVIVVDDASTDDTPSVLAALTDRRVRTIRQPGNGGVSGARNAAIAQARGEWVAFLDDDDEWVSHKLQAQLARLDANTDPKTKGVYCSLTIMSPEGRRLPPGARHMPEGQILHDLVRAEQIVSPSTYVVERTALVEVGGFDEALFAVEDRDLWLRMAQAGHHFVSVTEPLVLLGRTRTNGMTNDPTTMIRGLARFHRRWDALAKVAVEPGVRRAIVWNRRRMLARLHRKQVKRLLSSGRRGRAWRYVRAVAPVLPMFPWAMPYVARGLTIVLLGAEARRFVGVPSLPKREAPSVQAEADST